MGSQFDSNTNGHTRVQSATFNYFLPMFQKLGKIGGRKADGGILSAVDQTNHLPTLKLWHNGIALCAGSQSVFEILLLSIPLRE